MLVVFFLLATLAIVTDRDVGKGGGHHVLPVATAV